MKKCKEAATLAVGLGLVMLFTSVSGIGCPIKWFTGISCAGCGMTRALFSAVRLQFGEAFRYHPLFWTLPFLALFVLFGEKLPPKTRRIVTWVMIACFTAVYLVRMFLPDDNIVSADLSQSIAARLWRHFAERVSR